MRIGFCVLPSIIVREFLIAHALHLHTRPEFIPWLEFRRHQSAIVATAENSPDASSIGDSPPDATRKVDVSPPVNRSVPIERLRFADGQLIRHPGGVEYVPLEEKLSKGSRLLLGSTAVETKSYGLARFGQRELLDCFHDKRVLFYGDSRVRILFSSFVESLMGKDNYPREFPHHRACPGHNAKYEHDEACAQFLTGGKPRSFETTHAGVTASFQWHPNALEPPMLEAHPDVVFMSIGAHAVYTQRGVGHLEESEEDRANFIDSMSKALQDTSALKVFVSYPACRDSDGRLKSVVEGMLPHLSRNNWTFYDSRGVTDPKFWRLDAGARTLSAWSTNLLPRDYWPEESKWDQCEGPHTWDTLADLEMQILYNNLCRSSSAN
jgi:hypothetical protein